MKPNVKLISVRFLICLTVVLACSGLGGCGMSKAEKSAEQVLAKHFRMISTNGFDSAVSNYGIEFFQNTTPEEWTRILQRLNAKVGNYQSHTVTRWRVYTTAGGFGSGTTVLLQCQVNYSRSSIQETFRIFKHNGQSEYKIVGHQITGVILPTE